MFFRELIGHTTRLEELRRLLSTGRVPHALLLTGPRGIGKRAAANAIAAARLCDAAGDEACGGCTSCRTLARGNHPDFELLAREPGKRDIGIGQVRALLETLHRKSQHSAGRVAVLDDAERMTVEAQNAFLKTLEEPPAGTLLLLISANPDRLLATVRSRCSVHRFGSLSAEEMEEYRARHPGLACDLPLGLALGSPGRLTRLHSPGVDQGFEVLREFVRSPSSQSPFELAARLLESAAAGGRREQGQQEEEVDDSRERTRDGLSLLLGLLALLLRDQAVRATGLDDHLLSGDVTRSLPRSHDPDTVLDALELVDAAAVRMRRNLDPALTLEEMFARIASLLS